MTDAPGLMKLRRPEWKWKDCVFTPTHTEIVFTLYTLRHSSVHTINHIAHFHDQRHIINVPHFCPRIVFDLNPPKKSP